MAAPLVRSGQLAFAEEYGSEASAGLKLFQVDDKMLKYLLDGGKLYLKGGPTDNLVAVTETETFTMTLVESSNSMLLLRPATDADQALYGEAAPAGGDAAGAAAASSTSGIPTTVGYVVEGNGRGHYELGRAAPPLYMVRQLLEERPYAGTGSLNDDVDGGDGDDADGEGMAAARGGASGGRPGASLEHLVAAVQASAAEVAACLASDGHLGALQWAPGRWTVLDEDYEDAALTALLRATRRQGWPLAALPVGEAVAELCGRFDSAVLRHVIAMHATGKAEEGEGAAAAASPAAAVAAAAVVIDSGKRLLHADDFDDDPAAGDRAAVSFALVARAVGRRLLRQMAREAKQAHAAAAVGGAGAAAGSSGSAGGLSREASTATTTSGSSGTAAGASSLSSSGGSSGSGGVVLPGAAHAFHPHSTVVVANAGPDASVRCDAFMERWAAAMPAGSVVGVDTTAPPSGDLATSLPSAAAAAAGASDDGGGEEEDGIDGGFRGVLSLPLLRGWCILDVSTAGTRFLRYLPHTDLEPTPPHRFAQLFAVRQRWRVDDLAPYIAPLVGIGRSRDDLLLVHTRSIAQADGSRLFVAR